MMLGEPRHYVPILKAKPGDFWALSNVRDESAGLVTPLIECVPPSASRTEEGQLGLTVRSIERHWTGRTLFIDLMWRDGVAPLPSGRHVLDEFFWQAIPRRFEAIPVTSPTRSPAYQQAVRAVVDRDRRGIAVRIPPELIGTPAMGASIDRLMGLIGLEPAQVHVILDYRVLHDSDPNILAQVMQVGVGSLPRPAEWASVTVAGSSFPGSLANFPRDQWTRRPRKEWQSWRSLTANLAGSSRAPAYGDYAVGDPELPFTERASFTANLRYSVDGDFFVWRGHATKTHPDGHGQMFSICADLAARPEFAGDSFSAGDHEIAVRATTRDSPGAPADWRKWATSHYIELVASQLASLPGL